MTQEPINPEDIPPINPKWKRTITNEPIFVVRDFLWITYKNARRAENEYLEGSGPQQEWARRAEVVLRAIMTWDVFLDQEAIRD